METTNSNNNISNSQNTFKAKFFTNNKENIISESLLGCTYQNQNIIFYKDSNILIDKAQLKHEKVRLICGGGSGHEPAHGGFVAEGYLTAAVCGDVFSSPSYPNIQKAIDLVYSPKGVIILIKNYGGDVINFSLAAEIAKAQGKKVEILIVDDDISLKNLNENEKNEKDEKAFNKRRGLCGIVYLYKILGAMCQQGFAFEEILEYGKHLIPSLYTLGVSLTSSITPFPCFDDLKNEIIYCECEVGLGIHGEQGKERIKYESVDGLIEYCFKNVFEQNMKKEFFNFTKEANSNNNKNDSNNRNINIVLNNLGSCTDIEMSIIFLSLKTFIKKNYQSKINVARYFCGKFMTSLDMRGFSITICDLDQNAFLEENKQKIFRFLDATVNANLFPAIDLKTNNHKSRVISEGNTNQIEQYENKNSAAFKILFFLCNYLIEKSDFLNHLDKEVADGDLGIGVEKGCSSILKNLQFLNFEENLKSAMKQIGNLIACNYGGTSGPLFASFLIKGAESLLEKEDSNTHLNWICFFCEGSKMMQQLGKAKLNDKTMIDVLIPICDYFNEFVGDAKAFDFKDFQGKVNFKLDVLLEKIKLLKSKKGRSSYQQGKEVGKDDPGCVLVSLVIKFVLEKIREIRKDS